MAYAAVISLLNRIKHLLNFSNISIAASTREIIEFASEEVTSLQHVLIRLDDSSCRSKRLNALDREIRERVYKIEDVFESHVLLSQPVDDEEVRQEITSFMEAAKKMKEEYNQELDNPTLPDVDEQEEEFSTVSSDIVVELFDVDFNKIREKLLGRKPYELCVFSYVGMPGTGRSIWAKNDFERRHSLGAWVSIGPKYQFKQILIDILSQVDPEENYKLLISQGEEKLAEHLRMTLKGARYLIALDNVCDTDVWNYLRTSLPEEYNGSRVFLTTSLEEVALSANSYKINRVPILSEEESWNFFQLKVFGEDSCPPILEKAAKKIVKSCQGLHLEIAKLALFLSKAEKTPEHWNKVAAERENSAFNDAYNEISEISRIIGEIQLNNKFHGGGDDHDDSNSSTYSDIIVKDMLGLSHATPENVLFPYLNSNSPILFNSVSLNGMAGMGKTTLAKKIFNDPSILCHFDYCVWITLGPKYQSERILIDILVKIDPDIGKMHMEGDETLVNHLCTLLSNKKCLIVLDDLWNNKPLSYMEKMLSPKFTFEILKISRLKHVCMPSTFGMAREMRLLDKEKSWCLLRKKVFAEKLCPSELERSGKMIAQNCEGLPLMIVAVASLLSQAEKTPEFWNKVAMKKNLIFKQANDRILKVLLPSYEYLPQELKAFFLYLGVFPQNYDAPFSKLVKLCGIEGIIGPNYSPTFENVRQYLDGLMFNSLLIATWAYNFQYKTCRLHSVFLHLSVTEARKNKFFHVLNCRDDGLVDDMKGQRRLCIQNNSLFGIKEVHNAMGSVLTARSLLCTGPTHPYPVPICLKLRLLRILDALTVRFYEFPIEVLNLAHLRYLALTCDGKLPPSTSKLKDLECLIVRRHLCTKLHGDPSYLPLEIWDMQELKHLQVVGSDLPDPNCQAFLINLITLLDVGTYSCTKNVLERLPNLKRLRVQIELRPDAVEPLGWLNHIFILPKLESLKCDIVNPEVMSEIVPHQAPLSMFPSSLKRLCLSGFGYPWEYMRTIALLPNLKVLKLRKNAFRGPEWVTRKGEFEELAYLLLEDTDLVYWIADDDCCLRNLGHLMIRHCYKLKEIPLQSLSFVYDVELVDCNPLASKQILDSDKLKGHSSPRVEYSWKASGKP